MARPRWRLVEPAILAARLAVPTAACPAGEPVNGYPGAKAMLEARQIAGGVNCGHPAANMRP